MADSMGPVAIAQLLRPVQWTKNLLVFAALIFSGSYQDRNLLLAATITFLAMCLASSGTYALNDVIDADLDRSHPTKKERPVASGKISPPAALTIAAICAAGGVALGFLQNRSVGIGIMIYLAIQIFYVFGVKRIAVLDVFVLSSGFVLRAILGALAIHVNVSIWLLLCTGALALLLGFGKRRSEFRTQGQQRNASRPALGSYTSSALDALLLLSACCAVITFGMYVVESDTAHRFPALLLTAPVVAFGIYRYVFLAFGADEGGDPENLLFRDPQILVTLLVFIGLALYATSGGEVPFVLKQNP